MNSDDNKSFWQRVARLYTFAMRSSAPMYDALCDRIRAHLCNEMKVLEIACGTGQLSFPLAESVRCWEATDFSPAMIEGCQKILMERRIKALNYNCGYSCPGESLKFSVEDATQLSFPSDFFDGVVIANALHIMPQPDRALAEIRRVIKDDGLLFAPTFVHDETNQGSGGRVRFMNMLGFKVYHHWTGASFVSFLESHCFSPLNMRFYTITFTCRLCGR